MAQKLRVYIILLLQKTQVQFLEPISDGFMVTTDHVSSSRNFNTPFWSPQAATCIYADTRMRACTHTELHTTELYTYMCK